MVDFYARNDGGYFLIATLDHRNLGCPKNIIFTFSGSEKWVVHVVFKHILIAVEVGIQVKNPFFIGKFLGPESAG